jgi:hypothetical protein
VTLVVSHGLSDNVHMSFCFIPLVLAMLFLHFMFSLMFRLSLITMQLEEKEKSLMAAEAEVNALNR